MAVHEEHFTVMRLRALRWAGLAAAAAAFACSKSANVGKNGSSESGDQGGATSDGDSSESAETGGENTLEDGDLCY